MRALSVHTRLTLWYAGALLARSSPLEPRLATFARTAGDEVVATFFPGPRSYTGQDVVEVSAHGNPVILRAIVDRAMSAAAGETFRGTLLGYGIANVWFYALGAVYGLAAGGVR